MSAQIDITAGYRIVSGPKLRTGPVGLLYRTFRVSKAVGERLSRAILDGQWLNFKTKFL